MPGKISPDPFHEAFEPIELGGTDLEIDAIAAHRNILDKRYDEAAKKAGEATVEMLKALALKLEDGSLKTADPFTEGNIFVKVPTESGVHHINPFSAAKSQVNHALGVVVNAIDESALKVADPFTEGAIFKEHGDISHLKETTMNILSTAGDALKTITAFYLTRLTGCPTFNGGTYTAIKESMKSSPQKVVEGSEGANTTLHEHEHLYEVPTKDLSTAEEAVRNALVSAIHALQVEKASAIDVSSVPKATVLDEAKLSVADAQVKTNSAFEACAQALKLGLLKLNGPDVDPENAAGLSRYEAWMVTSAV